MMKILFLCLLIPILGQGCSTAGRAGHPLNGDVRLTYVTAGQLEDAIQRKECIVISGSNGSQDYFAVDESTTVEVVLGQIGGGFVHDSKALLARRDSAIERPAWYDKERAQERARFMKTRIEPGDLIVLRAVRW